MDEPTNHLDLTSREALEEALSRYEGTLLLVSHDRYFLDKLIHRVIELEDGQLIEYAGNYSYYLEKRQQASGFHALPPSRPKTTLLGRKSKEQKREEALARQQISKKRNKMEMETGWLEDEIERYEQKKKEIEEYLCRPDAYQDKEYAVRMQKDLVDANRKLQTYYSEWEQKRIGLEDLLSELERPAALETKEE